MGRNVIHSHLSPMLSTINATCKARDTGIQYLCSLVYTVSESRSICWETCRQFRKISELLTVRNFKLRTNGVQFTTTSLEILEFFKVAEQIHTAVHTPSSQRSDPRSLDRGARKLLQSIQTPINELVCRLGPLTTRHSERGQRAQ